MADQATLEKLVTRRFIHIPAPNPVFIAGEPGAWDENFVECCNVIKDGETYYLYYHGHARDEEKWPGANYRLGVASSPHPLGAWTRHDGNPIIDHGPEGSWEDDWVACAAVLKEEKDRYYMWYSGNFSVGLATASHPLGPWEKHPDNPIIPHDFGYVGGVVKVDGRYYMFNEYPRGKVHPSPDQGPMSVATADRPEGPWELYDGNPALMHDDWGSWEDGGYSEAGLLYHDGIFHTFYGGTKWEKLESIGYACSLDGFNFVKHVDNPVAPRERNPDATGFAEVHAVYEKPFYYLFHTLRYQSRTGFETWAEDIGVQILATQTPFRLPLPALALSSLGAGEISALDNPLTEDGRTRSMTGCPPISLEAATSCSITVECAYAETATAGLRVHVLSSLDGIACDTEPYSTFDLPLRPGERMRATQSLDASVMFVRVQVENLDKKEAVGDVKVTAVVGAD